MNRNILLILIIILIICIGSTKENWVNYQQVNFGKVQTGSSPISFYNRPIYRKPYRWPVCQPVDYPVKHCQPFSI